MSGFYAWPPRILQTLSWVPTRLALNVFCRFEVEGAEYLQGLPNAIFAVNHANELDPIILTAALDPLGRFAPMFYLTAPVKTYDEAEYGWCRHLYASSWFFKVWGAYPTNSGHKNYAVSLANHVTLLQEGRSVCIFPEGWVTRDGNLQEGHGGAAYLSQASGVAIIPTAISGSYRMNAQRFFKRRYRIAIRFGKPILPSSEPPAETLPPEYFKAKTEVVMSAIRAQLRQSLPLDESFFVRIAYWTIRKVLGPLVRLIWVERVRGLEHIPKRGGVLIVFNHESYFDFICFIAVCPRPIHFLAAEKFFKHPAWRTIMKATGQIKVERTSSDKQLVHDTVYAHLANDKVIGIFPEGTRAPDEREMLKAFTGVAQYAVAAKVPIVPVGIRGTFAVMSRHAKRPRFIKNVTIKVGNALHPETFAHLPVEKDSYRKLTDFVMHRISELSDKLYPHAQKIDTL